MWNGDPKAWNPNNPSPSDIEKVKETEAALKKEEAAAAAAHDKAEKAKAAASKVPVVKTKADEDREKADIWIAKAKQEGRWPPVNIPDFVEPYIDCVDHSKPQPVKDVIVTAPVFKAPEPAPAKYPYTKRK